LRARATFVARSGRVRYARRWRRRLSRSLLTCGLTKPNSGKDRSRCRLAVQPFRRRKAEEEARTCRWAHPDNQGVLSPKCLLTLGLEAFTVGLSFNWYSLRSEHRGRIGSDGHARSSSSHDHHLSVLNGSRPIHCPLSYPERRTQIRAELDST